MRLRSFFSPILLCSVLLAPACADPVGPREEYPRLWVRQTGVILNVGEQAQLSAKVHRGPRQFVEDATGARWWTDQEQVVQMDGSGRVHALAPGRATVWVQLEGVRDSGTVVVRGPTAEYRTRWRMVEVGNETTCGLTVEGRAYCWGRDYFGAIGDGVRRQWTLTFAPVAITGGHTFAEVDVGLSHACGRTPAGQALCWGDLIVVGTRPGQQEHLLAPAPVAFPGSFTQLRTGGGHVCGLAEEGQAYCWGINAHGEIGDGAAGISNHRYAPTPVHTDLRFQEIVPGHYATCALSTDGAAYCWGMGDYGRLGTGREEGDRLTPAAVAGDHRFRSLSGEGHTCGLTVEESVYCWGPNRWFQLGHDSMDYALGPVPVGQDLGFAQVFAGAVTTCGILLDGSAYCWGWSRDGNLGTEEPVTQICGGVDRIPCSSRPLPVAGGLRFTQISASMTATCGITTDSALYCWGSNKFGQLGNGSLVERSPVPVRVADPL